jgi:serine protease Do
MSIRAHIRARMARLLVGILFLVLIPQLIAGCGKSSEQTALDDKIVSQRAAAAAQAELDADQEKFRRMAVGEQQAPEIARAVPESPPAVAPRSLEIASKERPPAVGAAPAAATLGASSAPRSAENVFAEVAPSVARIQVMDVSGHVIALGSGVVIDKAVVLTNCHVAKRGVKLTVKIGDAVMPATIQLADEEFDLCRLTVPGLVAPAVAIGSVASLRTGQRVYAIGAPAGLELTISEGIVSALRKVDEGTVIQTTAPISPGSSGGGLFDASGAMVGIVTFQHRFGQNLNFALPADWIGQMRARRASDATLQASLSGNPSDASSALILGQWICRDWVSGRTSQYTFEPDGTVSIAMSEGHVGTLNYRISGKTLQVSDAKQTRTTKIEELTSGKMVLHGPDQSIACER